jgi:hypothetical protein
MREPDPADPRGSTMPPPDRRFIIFTCRDARTDFRWPLAEALRARHETWYIWLRRRPRLQRPGVDAVFEEISFPALLALLMRLTRTKVVNIYLNSTNTSFPIMMLLLRWLCGRGLWVMDMHDDLLYSSTGLARARAAIAVKVQVRAADIIIRSAQSLVELFPNSVAFGNASQIRPIARQAADYRSVLVLASLDRRFDFDFMAEVAAASPARVFDIYGQVSEADAQITANVAALCHNHGNVVYHGAYGLADLEPILSRYAVTLAPYCTRTRLTRYLDPLRYYHCLNSGMELITTDIPQADRLRSSLHVVTMAAEVAPILIQLETCDAAKRNTGKNYHLHTWEQRAEDLIGIATAHVGGSSDIVGKSLTPGKLAAIDAA